MSNADHIEVIIGMDLKSPGVAAQRRWPITSTSDMLPTVRTTSDIFWPYWIQDNPNPRSLRYHLTIGIINLKTRNILTSSSSARNIALEQTMYHVSQVS